MLFQHKIRDMFNPDTFFLKSQKAIDRARRKRERGEGIHIDRQTEKGAGGGLGGRGVKKSGR